MKFTLLVLQILFLITVGHTQPQVSLPVVGKLPFAVQMHGSAVVSGRFYLLGGEVEGAGWSNAVHSAEISADAHLTNWREEAPLPQRRAYTNNGVEVIGNHIYILCGNIATEPGTPESQLSRASDVLWATVGPGGEITEWKSAPFPMVPTSLFASCTSGNHLIFTGGNQQGQNSADVFVSAVGPDGTPGPWKTSAVLPATRWFHSAAAMNNRVYVWSGLNTSDKSVLDSTVYSAPLLADGSMGPWRSETPMPQPVYSAGGCGMNDILVTIGGRYANAYPTNAIWMSRLNQGQAGPWTMLATDLKARTYHSVAMDKERGWVFVSGGRDKTTPGTGGGVHLDVVQACQLK